MSSQPPTAISDEGHPPYEEEFRAIGQLLEREAEPIMERWFERASKEQVHASEHLRVDVMNDLLQMLQSLGQRLQEQSIHALDHATAVAAAHGHQRVAIGWNIVDLVQDYELLHGAALEHLGRVWGERLSYRQAMVLAMVMNRATGSAVDAYSQGSQEGLQAQVKQQRADLRRMTLELTDAEHHLRKEFAAFVHDEFQQMLVAMRMKLDATRSGTKPCHITVAEIDELLAQTLDLSRNITTDLCPLVIENKGLPAAIEWLAETFKERYGLTVTLNLQVPHDARPGPLALQRLMFDAIRELLFNVVKHAHADQARVSICCDETSPWRIEVEDRGKGSADMGRPDASPGRSFGLGHARHRIEQVGGTMQIDSRPNQGTRVVLTVPLELNASELQKR